MEIDIRPTLLGFTIGTIDSSRLEDSYRYLTPFDGTLVVCDTIDIGTSSTTVRDQILLRVCAEVLDRDLMVVIPADVVAVVMLDIYRIKPGKKVLGDAIEQTLMENHRLQVMKGWIANSLLYYQKRETRSVMMIIWGRI